MKKVISIVMAAALLGIVGFAGWAPEATAGPITTPSPAAPPHDRVSISILTGRLGSQGYLFATAVADILNKKHPWIRATAIEGYGAMASLVEGSEMDPKTVFCTGAGEAYWVSMLGLKPMKKKYTNIKMVMSAGSFTVNVFATFDPDIKSIHDCVGKKVAIPPKYFTAFIWAERAFKWAGIRDKVKLVDMPLKAGAGALKDGLVDAAVFLCGILPDKYPVHPAWEEVVAVKGDKLYFFSVPGEPIDLIYKEMGIPWPKVMTTFPPRALGPHQLEPVTGVGLVINILFGFEGADEDVVYEVVKTVADNLELFHTYNVNFTGATREKMAKDLADRVAMEQYTREISPGALRYYREQGLLR